MTMSMSAEAKTPWHLWVVGVLALLWNGYGGYDFVMTFMKGEAYFRAHGMSDAQIAYFQSMPNWLIGPWALGVWSSVAGSILLLLRMRWAFHAFVVSLLGLTTTLVYTYLLSDGGKIGGVDGTIMYAVIAAVIVLLAWYSHAMAKRGVLR
ncbi:hypothetical protein [Caulobacter sp. 17J65-9]|uniref:hypothetical protein n=1 Tax=Caulobacter sp. 17J65-9 TaxID=2709382 RepID=UPI0013CDB8CC|nr:hypothetical protein [Caulobacter sp. 17J65-9]NEX93254.1 hypothetical protein [Caulobacter sp. 17J65-9]